VRSAERLNKSATTIALPPVFALRVANLLLLALVDVKSTERSPLIRRNNIAIAVVLSLLSDIQMALTAVLAVAKLSSISSRSIISTAEGVSIVEKSLAVFRAASSISGSKSKDSLMGFKCCAGTATAVERKMAVSAHITPHLRRPLT
jgi:hypothetical protein